MSPEQKSPEQRSCSSRCYEEQHFSQHKNSTTRDPWMFGNINTDLNNNNNSDGVEEHLPLPQRKLSFLRISMTVDGAERSAAGQEMRRVERRRAAVPAHRCSSPPPHSAAPSAHCSLFFPPTATRPMTKSAETPPPHRPPMWLRCCLSEELRLKAL